MNQKEKKQFLMHSLALSAATQLIAEETKKPKRVVQDTITAVARDLLNALDDDEIRDAMEQYRDGCKYCEHIHLLFFQFPPIPQRPDASNRKNVR